MIKTTKIASSTHLPLMILLFLLAGCGSARREAYTSQEVTTATKRPMRRSPDKNNQSYFTGKGIKQTNQSEALFCKDHYQKRGENSLACKYLEHLLTIVKDHQLRGELMLELADLCMKLDRRDRAASLYKQYKMLYPGSSHIKHVLYQEITARQKDSLPSLKDQTKTRETLNLAKEFLQEFPDDTEYTDSVKDMQKISVLTLMRSELNTAEFYATKVDNPFDSVPKEAHLQAAQLRLEHILREYTPMLEDTRQFDTLELNQEHESLQARQQFLLTTIKALQAYVDTHLSPDYKILNIW